MKHSILFFLMTLIFAASGCSQVNATPSPIASTKPPGVEDKTSLVAALEAAGATVVTGDSISQDFFTVEGSTIKVNGADIQVFEYGDTQALEKDASQVAPDGGSVGTSIMMWMDTPHFYKAGRILVLYVGSDQTTLSLLEKVLGPQFAGGS